MSLADALTYGIVGLWAFWQVAAGVMGARAMFDPDGELRWRLKNPGARRLLAGVLALPLGYGVAATVYGLGGCSGGLKRLAECTEMAPALGQAAYNLMLAAAILGPGLGMLSLIGAAILEMLARRNT